MRTLVTFIWKYNFTFLFLILEAVAFLLIVQGNRFHQASFFSWTNTATGGYYDVVSNVGNYFELKKINDDLSQQNADLLKLKRNAYTKLRGPHVYIKDTLYRQQYKFLTAKAVKNSTELRNNYIILNQGTEQGIEPQMGVINSNGVVGIVKDVSQHYCSVISLLNSKTQISAKIKKNSYFGLVTWNGYDPTVAQLNNIPNHVKLVTGDTIVSMGSSAIFPTDVAIGTIKNITPKDGDDFYEIDIELSTNFSNLSYVYLVKNLLKGEQLELEEKLTNEE